MTPEISKLVRDLARIPDNLDYDLPDEPHGMLHIGEIAKAAREALTSISERTVYEWRDVAELPPWDEQPGRQFIRLEGSRDHSGVNWHRVYCGIAYIRRPGEPDEMLGYRDTDIIQLCDEGDMDLFSATVTHWMPARFPAIPASVSGSTEGGNG